MHHSIHDRPKNSWRRLACQAAAASVYVAVGLSIFAGSRAEAADARAEAAPAAPVPGMSGELRPVRIGYLREAVERPAPASRLDMEPRDAGIAGARQGLGENNAGGQFMGHLYSLGVANGISSEKAVAALEKLYQSGHNYIIADASAETLLKLSDYARGKDIMLFNVRATDVSLRQEDCRSNVMHIVPDRYMLADALAQYLVKMDWKNWLLVHGSMPDDLAYLEAVQRAAGRFGANVVDVREYQDISGGRRDDVGTIPPSTSGKDDADYDVIVVADEAQLFGPQIPYRGGAKPRVVAGTTGLVATTWSRGHEKWGATQANNNFEKDNRRLMLPIDYQAYVATRAIGEAVTRNANADFKTVAKFIHSDKLQLAPFKGIKQQFRPWDGQFRQPILIATEKVPVSVSPQRGFPHASHPEIEVDTLGIDEPESKCRMETTAAAAPG